MIPNRFPATSTQGIERALQQVEQTMQSELNQFDIGVVQQEEFGRRRHRSAPAQMEMRLRSINAMPARTRLPLQISEERQGNDEASGLEETSFLTESSEVTDSSGVCSSTNDLEFGIGFQGFSDSLNSSSAVSYLPRSRQISAEQHLMKTRVAHGHQNNDLRPDSRSSFIADDGKISSNFIHPSMTLLGKWPMPEDGDIHLQSCVEKWYLNKESCAIPTSSHHLDDSTMGLASQETRSTVINSRLLYGEELIEGVDGFPKYLEPDLRELRAMLVAAHESSHVKYFKLYPRIGYFLNEDRKKLKQIFNIPNHVDREVEALKDAFICQSFKQKQAIVKASDIHHFTAEVLAYHSEIVNINAYLNQNERRLSDAHIGDLKQLRSEAKQSREHYFLKLANFDGGRFSNLLLDGHVGQLLALSRQGVQGRFVIQPDTENPLNIEEISDEPTASGDTVTHSSDEITATSDELTEDFDSEYDDFEIVFAESDDSFHLSENNNSSSSSRGL